jgi:glycosyltransferase involved in cell wall biosynthesis
MKVSIIIITRNRVNLLSKCLEPLFKQIESMETIEVIVVDNNSSDETIDFLKKITVNSSKFKYFIEDKVGASHARNLGILNSEGEWLCFLDDDGIPSEDFVEKMLHTISNFNFDGFGGMWYPYADKEIPSWIPNEVTTMRLLSNNTSVLGKGTTVAAGICAFKKEIVVKAGCFSTEIGPRDGKMGYGEEDYLQQIIWKNGGLIGFNPYWTMKHIVADYKFSLKWNLNRYYLKGRDSNAYLPPIGSVNKIKIGFRILLVPTFLLIRNLPKLVMSKNYFWQHWILDSFKYSLRMFGRLNSKI